MKLIEKFTGLNLLSETQVDSSGCNFTSVLGLIDKWLYYAHGNLVVPDNFDYIILVWLQMHKTDFNAIYTALDLADYNPIDNYNMTETAEDNTTSAGTTTYNTTDTTTDNTVTTKDSSTNYGHIINDTDNTDNTESSAVIDTDTLKTDSKSVTTDTSTTTNSGTDSTNDTIDSERDSTIKKTGTDSTDNTSKSTHTLTRKGNIGVTTSQQMIESELQLRLNNFVKHVAEVFVNELTLGVYSYDY